MKPDRKTHRKAALKKWKALSPEERVAFNRQLAEDIHSDCAAWDDCMNEHMSGIMAHYANARKKHPYFCDIIKNDDLQFDFAEWLLEDCRKRLVHAREANVVRWDELLDCEKYEAMVEIKHGDTAHAVEECYDAISVLLRTIDVLEGRQKLGNAEEGASA